MSGRPSELSTNLGTPYYLRTSVPRGTSMIPGLPRIPPPVQEWQQRPMEFRGLAVAIGEMQKLAQFDDLLEGKPYPAKGVQTRAQPRGRCPEGRGVLRQGPVS